MAADIPSGKAYHKLGRGSRTVDVMGERQPFDPPTCESNNDIGFYIWPLAWPYVTVYLKLHYRGSFGLAINIRGAWIGVTFE